MSTPPSAPADDSPHTALIKRRLPGWVALSHAADIRRLRPAISANLVREGPAPVWLSAAGTALRQALSDSQKAQQRSHAALAKTLQPLKSVTDFAKPLLVEALAKTFGTAPDVLKNSVYYLRYRQPTEQHTLLEAALLNFQGNEDFAQVVLQETSALAPDGALTTEELDSSRPHDVRVRYRYSQKLAITPDQFRVFCRSLDLGKQYQDHLASVFHAPGTAGLVRQQMIQATRDLMAVRTHTARMKNEISEPIYRLLLSIQAGEDRPRLQGRAVAYTGLSILGFELGEALVIGVPAQTVADLVPGGVALPGAAGLGGVPVVARGRITVWIPGAPLYPLKEYASMQAFESDLAINLRTPAYQKLFSSLVPQGDAPAFLQRLKSKLYTYRGNPRTDLLEQVYDDAITLDLRETVLTGELFGALYDRHIERLKNTALKLAVPTAEADRAAARERHAHWLSLGLNFLNVAAFFIPGLGEVMMAVTAIQLVVEVYEGVESWRQGDMDAALEHMESVGLNVAFMAALGTAGALASRAPVIQVSQWVDGTVSVTLPDGQARLWKPDLAPYRSEVTLPSTLKPNALGQYEADGKTYIRIADGLHEQVFDSRLKKWRIKHPENPNAYQPILHHNKAGAWRHSHELPLKWDRLTLLRRLGHDTRSFSDETLTTIGEVSGVSDDLLRKVHVDGAPVPAALMDTLRQFRADQEVVEVIEHIRSGRGLNPRCAYALPLIVEMPGWPAGRVLEVFEGPQPWGRSQRYGEPLSAADVRPSVKVTRTEVRNGELSRKVLAGLSEQEAKPLLGSYVGTDTAAREQAFNQRLGEHAVARKSALAESLYRSTEPQVRDADVFQRTYRSLSRHSISEILATASEKERAELQHTGRIPDRLHTLARIEVQQGILNRGISGLYLESLATLASDRLALHGLEHLPGWSTDVRLELRADHSGGRLIDSIGDEGAAVRKYLVKDGDCYQAFNERGEALNAQVSSGRNFFESLMHALPDEARRALGLAHVAQHADLQRRLATYVSAHREQMAGIFKWRLPKSRPSFRRATPGYSALRLSGGAQTVRVDQSLIGRVRTVYPNLDDDQAWRWIQDQLLGGRSSTQIYSLLRNREREFEELWGTLSQWQHEVEVMTAHTPTLRRTPHKVVEGLIDCWRQGWNRDQPAHAQLDLTGVDRLPPLEANFSHVQGLTLSSEALSEDRLTALVAPFDKASRLDVFLGVGDLSRPAADIQASHLAALTRLADGLAGLPRITELSISGWMLSYPPAFLQRLASLAPLERLRLSGLFAGDLEVTRLTQLRSLSVSGGLRGWPIGVLNLEHLGVLDVSGLRLPSLPAALFTGHERLWRGLRVNWGALEPQSFMQAYTYVRDNPAHLLDVDSMVFAYCRTLLAEFKPGDFMFPARAINEFNRLALTNDQRLLRLNNLREEHRALELSLDTWAARVLGEGGQVANRARRLQTSGVLREYWKKDLDRRLGIQAPVAGPSSAPDTGIAPLDLANGVLLDLPELPAGAFAEVQHLNLHGTQPSIATLERFLTSFPSLRTLKLGDTNLMELPASLTEMASLRELDLSRNQLTVTPVMQSRLNRLTQLFHLNLQQNRLGSLDVSALTQLRSLDVSRSAIEQWPTGVLALPELTRLDLSHSAITSIPPEAFSAHAALLRGTRLRGCRLTPQTVAQVQRFAMDLDAPLGISRAQLAMGRTGGDPEFYPPDASLNAEYLIPLPWSSVEGEALLSPAQRLLALDPAQDLESAQRALQALADGGLSATVIDARLTEWNRQYGELVQGLNTWIDITAYRQRGEWITAANRRRAASNILNSWRAALPGHPASERSLTLSFLPVGALPALPRYFDSITELNLQEVGLQGRESNEFLRAFPQVNVLRLTQNGLSALPEAVGELSALTRLEAMHNELTAAQVQPQLSRLSALEYLDLSQNRLEALDVSAMPRLQTLKLSGNRLDEWPAGVLQAADLHTLDLSNNLIDTLPEGALGSRHAALMRGTDITDNPLSSQALEQLLEYRQRTGSSLSLGEGDIRGMLGSMSDTESEWLEHSEGEELEDDVFRHPDVMSESDQKAQWFTHVPADSGKHAVWSALKAQPNNQDFFGILARLKNTKDFLTTKAELTRRVWEVLQAMADSEPLQDQLFEKAQALMLNATCDDGYMLMFSDLEVAVYQARVLATVTAGQEGSVLLDLTTRMIRLDKVEAIANEVIARKPAIDAAEVRLAYRIGLKQRLNLPGQPADMLYRNVSEVTEADLDSAYSRIIAQESGEQFLGELASREYWVDYLKRTYPGDFRGVAQAQEAKLSALEDRFPDLGNAYQKAVAALGLANQAETLALATRLSGLERTRLGQQAGETAP